jgi:hypothetical protein
MKYHKILFTIIFSQMLFVTKAQNTIKKENGNTFYTVTTGLAIGMGPGIGKSLPTNKANIGIGINAEFALQKNKWLYAVGYRVISDFEILNNTKGKNSVQSTELLF